MCMKTTRNGQGLEDFGANEAKIKRLIKYSFL